MVKAHPRMQLQGASDVASPCGYWDYKGVATVTNAIILTAVFLPCLLAALQFSLQAAVPGDQLLRGIDRIPDMGGHRALKPNMKFAF